MVIGHWLWATNCSSSHISIFIHFVHDKNSNQFNFNLSKSIKFIHSNFDAFIKFRTVMFICFISNDKHKQKLRIIANEYVKYDAFPIKMYKSEKCVRFLAAQNSILKMYDVP